MLAVRAVAVPHVEPGSRHRQLERVGQSEPEQSGDGKASVEMIPGPRADFRLGGIRTIHEHFSLRIGGTGVLDGVNNHDLDAHLFPDGTGQ